MERYIVYAYENCYGGLHGMYDIDIIEGEYEEVESLAEEMSYKVMDDYNCIEDYLEENDNDEYPIEAVRAENVAYEIFQVRNDILLTTDELHEKIAKENIDTIRAKYCYIII